MTEFYLARAGFDCDDVRLKRLISLAAEKFVSDIAADAFQYARLRASAGPGGRGRGPGTGTGAGAGPGGAGPVAGGSGAAGAAGALGGPNTQAARDRSRTVLTMDDLSAALSEYGINARRAEFFR